METEKLYREVDQYKEKLTNILVNYDLNNFDEVMKSAKKTEEWAESITNDLNSIFTAIESFMTCNICHDVIRTDNPDKLAMVALPCNHAFCTDCHGPKREFCPRCY